MNFIAGQKVLVRDDEEDKWEYAIFNSFSKDPNHSHPYYCMYTNWAFCIDYETNKEKLGQS